MTSPASTPTPAETTQDQDPTNPASWIISSAGVGPIRLGSALAAARGALGHFQEQPAASCPNPRVRIYSAPDAPLVWLVLDETAMTVTGIRLSHYPDGDGTDGGPHTATGIAVGSTIAEVRASYPDLSVEDSTGASNYSLTTDPTGWVTFSTSIGEDTSTVRNIDVYPGAPLFYELCG